MMYVCRVCGEASHYDSTSWEECTEVAKRRWPVLSRSKTFVLVACIVGAAFKRRVRA